MKKLYCLLVILLTFSCISNKRINYLQNLPENDPIALDEFIPYAQVDYEYILQPFDIVDISFASSNEELLQVFEFNEGSRQRPGTGTEGADMYFHTGYSIDKNG